MLLQDIITNTTVFCLLIGVAAFELWRFSKRSAEDVLDSLGNIREEERLAQGESSTRVTNEHLHDAYMLLGFYRAGDYHRFLLRSRFVLLAGMVALVGFKNVFFSFSSQSTFALLGIVIPLSYIIARRLSEKRKRNYIRQIEFYLPLVMERLVMGAQAGLDIIAAIGALERIESRSEAQDGGSNRPDPVSQLLFRVYRLTEGGLSFERALKQVVAPIPCSSLRHAFIHLSSAYTNGGELVMPLRELSDSTQAFYQESREEEIAKLPVRATAPLMCVFAGLMVIFMTSPVLQIVSMTDNFIPD